MTRIVSASWLTLALCVFAWASGNDKTIHIFHGPGCVPCEKMRKESWPDPWVQQEVDKYDRVMDWDYGNPAHRAQFTKYDVDAVPTVIIADSQGKVLSRLVGFADANKLRRFLRNE